MLIKYYLFLSFSLLAESDIPKLYSNCRLPCKQIKIFAETQLNFKQLDKQKNDQKMQSKFSNINIDSNNINSSNMMNKSQPLTDSVGKVDQINQSKPNNGIDITFRNITYSVQVQNKQDGSKKKITKTILNKISGICKAGEVTALMGTSGAGKTTLLNLLACRIKPTQGSLQANRKPYDYSSFGNFANYVMQKDVLMQTLTVRETLQFVANLKLDLSRQKKLQRIQSIAASMKLEKCMDVLVGGHLLKGISGGEKKRTSIAFQLISDPQVIMLDQPTSGLDSLTSFIIIDYLSELAHKKNKTVFMTIHQPNSEIFNKFDKLILLAEGNLVYQGRADLGIEYFANRLNKKMPQFMNPAQFFIEQMHQESQQNKKNLPIYFETYNKNMLVGIQQQIGQASTDEIQSRRTNISTSTSFKQLLKRDVINTIRNPMMLKSRLFQAVFLGIYTGGLYFNAGKKDYTDPIGWYTIVGYFFFICISFMMGSLSPVTLVFPSEKEVFLKQENARLYSVLPYFLSRNIVELPYLLILPIIINSILYWMVGQASTAQQFFLFYFVGLLVSFAGGSLGLLIGSIVTDEKANAALTPIVILPIFIFSGVFKNTGNLPQWIGWFQYISPLKYGFLSMITNETNNNRPSNISYLNLDLGMWPSIFVLIGLSLAFRVLSLFFLWLLKTKIQ